ncbi:MAG: polysaccharide biosynthesis tyrosine autokinase [Clostridia bacterium]|nr:polysaccharide biosynthesis tyrosine autokinase [Clostridia bacterium]
MEQEEKKQQDSQSFGFDIGRITFHSLQIVKRFWFIILAVIVLCAFGYSMLQQRNYTPSYRAYYSISVRVINKSTLSDTNTLYSVYYDQDLAEQLDATFKYLLNSDFLSDEIKEQLGDNKTGGSVNARSIKKSNIFVLTAYSNTPENASSLLEAVMAVYGDAARYVVGDMETEIIEGPIVDKTPYNAPNKTKNFVLGAFVGIVLCMGTVVLYSMFKRTVIQPDGLESYLNMQCFGVVPLMETDKNLKDDHKSVSVTREQGAFRESIRGIARKLESTMKRKDAKVIIVTSTASGEGKSVISRNLAESFAHWGKKVVLFDGDLRKPTQYKHFGFKKEQMSIEDVLSGKAAVETVTRKAKEDKLILVLNTVSVEKPTLLIDSPKMKKMMESFRSWADIVIIDTPPCGQLTDAFLFKQYADGILYVVQQDYMTVNRIVDAVEGINDSENKMLGYVLNGAQEITRGYGKYGYGKYSYGKYGSYGKYSYYSESGESKK